MTTSPLKEQLSARIKDAMRAKDAPTLSTLRFLSAAIKQKEVDDRRELDDAEVTAIIEKQIKQRRESIAAFEQGGRTESAEQERVEIVVLQTFLPAAATADEVDAAIQGAMAEVAAQGIAGAPAMGKIMAILKKTLAGRAEMNQISQQVKSQLQ